MLLLVVVWVVAVWVAWVASKPIRILSKKLKGEPLASLFFKKLLGSKVSSAILECT